MEGWSCPNCGRCYSPLTQMCSSCGPGSVTGSGTVYGMTDPTKCRACGADRSEPPSTGCPLGEHYGPFMP